MDRKDAEPCLKCAHCLAMADNKSLDVIEIDAASNTGVDNIRELRETVKLLPTLAAYKIYIIDEVHMLSSGAFNALLKTLEEPPKHVIFILATTALHKVPDTIVSRCQRFDFSRLPLDHIVEKLATIAKNEKVKIEPAALEMIALAAEGGMRDAESLLTQVIALEDKHITTAEVASILGITEQQKVEQYVEHLTERDLKAILQLTHQLVENGSDLYIFTNSLLHYLRQLLLVSIDRALIQNSPSSSPKNK
jgi:DNA polymerase-3 subunit gamma/tau